MKTVGPRQLDFADHIHAERCRLVDEDFQAAMLRLSDDGETREMLLEQRFLPSDQIQALLGTTRPGTVTDLFSIPSHPQGVMASASEAADILRMGAGVRLDLGSMIPRGTRTGVAGPYSAGPVATLDLFDAVCRCVRSTGVPTKSMSVVLPVDHPDSLEFIYATQNIHSLTALRFYVGITDEFMRSLQNGESSAAEVWQALIWSIQAGSAPGVLFLDTIRRADNLWYAAHHSATRVLGSMNLSKYLLSGGDFAWEQFQDDVRLAVRLLDQVIDRAAYPSRAQESGHKGTRAIGLGVTAMANCVETMGLPYGSAGYLDCQRAILSCMSETAYSESVELARERGTFPLLDREKFLRSPTFASTLPKNIQDGIRRYGIRNSHLTQIDPCRIVSLCAKNVSPSLEPVRRVMSYLVAQYPTGPFRAQVKDYGSATFGTEPRLLADVPPREHLDVQLAAQGAVDGEAPKLIPVTQEDDLQELYMRAWEGGAKECSTFSDSRELFSMSPLDAGLYACEVHPVTHKKVHE